MSESCFESLVIVNTTNQFENLYLEDVDFSYQNYKNVNFNGANFAGRCKTTLESVVPSSF